MSVLLSQDCILVIHKLITCTHCTGSHNMDHEIGSDDQRSRLDLVYSHSIHVGTHILLMLKIIIICLKS